MFNQITGDYLLVDDSKNQKIRESLTAPKRRIKKPVPGREGRINRHMQIWLINRN